MTFYIGGNSNGKNVEISILDSQEQTVPCPYGPHTGMQRKSETYVRTHINRDGEVKIFYVLSGEHPINHREQIIQLWDEVKTEIYAI